MVRKSRFFLFSSSLVLGFFLVLGIIGYKVNTLDAEGDTKERLTQIRIAKENEIKNDFRLLSNALLDASDKVVLKEFMTNASQDEKQIRDWLKASGGEQNWKSLIYQERKQTRPGDAARVMTQMSPYASFLQAYYMQNQKSREAFAHKFDYFQHHDKIHPYFRNLISRLQVEDILLVDSQGIVFYTVKKDILLGADLNVGIFSGTRIALAHKWAQTASPESINFFDFSESNIFTNNSVAFLATPVFANSTRLGTIILQIPSARIDEILSNNQDWRGLGLRETGEVVAFGPEGLLRNNSRQYLQSLLKQKQTVIVQSPLKANLGLSKAQLQAFYSEDDQFLQMNDYANQDTFASIGKVSLPGNVTWILITKMNAGEVSAFAHRRALPLAIFCFLLFLTALGIVYMVSLRFGRPLRLLNSEIENALESHPMGKLPAQRAEFKDLSENLEKLLSKMQLAEADLNFWRHTIAAIGDPVLVVSPIANKGSSHQSLQIVYLNSTAASLISLPADSLKNTDLKMWIEADFGTIAEKMQRIPLTPFKLEGFIKRSSGQRVSIELRWQPIWPQDPHSSFVIVAHEIQDKLDALKKATLLQQLLTESQELSATGSFRWDIKAGRLECTKEKLHLLGLDPKDPYPAYDLFRSLILIEDLPAFEKSLHEAIKNIHPFKSEYRIRKQDTGETLWVRTRGRTEYDDYGNAIFMYGVTQDITEERRQEQALIAAKNDALRSSHAKSEFLARMSHEIRTPMNAIMGMAELLKETQLSADQKHYTTIFCKAGEVLMALINDILDISKIEAGEVSIENIPFDFKKLMTDVEEIMRPKAAEKGVQFSYDIAPGVSHLLMGDPNKLRQILINLIGNSLKFTAAGSIRISINKNPAKKEALLISVKDTGIGIPTNKQHLIFQKFSQTDSSVARKYGGTGLGLAISKSLVELMGGQIWFKSQENEGTCFYLSVPYREQAGSHSLQRASDTAENELDFISTKSRPVDKKIKILIADDTEDNRTLFTHYLKNGPYEIIEAENGLEAVDKIKSEQFDIVFMDVQMPEMDGYTATGQIRSWEHDNHKDHLPIIALTAHALSEDRQKSLRAGCDDHVAKPFRKDTLLGVINRYSL